MLSCLHAWGGVMTPTEWLCGDGDRYGGLSIP